MGGGIKMSEVKKVLEGITVVISALKIITQHRGQVRKEKKREQRK